MAQVLAILAHLIGDYGLQSDWMVLNKQKRAGVCALHAMLYTIPFYFLCFPLGVLNGAILFKLSLIYVTHAIIDHYSLAKYFIRARNHVFSESDFRPDAELCEFTGMSASRPEGIRWIVYTITDNMFHLIINYYVLIM